ASWPRGGSSASACPSSSVFSFSALRLLCDRRHRHLPGLGGRSLFRPHNVDGLADLRLRLRGRCLLLGAEDLHHGHPLLTGRDLDERHLGQLGGQAVQDAPADLVVRHLPAPEDHGGLHLVAVEQEALRVALLELEVVLVDLGPELHFLHLDVLLVLARLRLPLGLLVEELSGVHDPADGRHGGGRDLHEVEALLLGDGEGLGRGHDAELGAVVVDDADFLGADAIVDADRPLVYETPPVAPGGTASSWVARWAARLAILEASALTLEAPRSPACRWRTATVPASISLSPTTSM